MIPRNKTRGEDCCHDESRGCVVSAGPCPPQATTSEALQRCVREYLASNTELGGVPVSAMPTRNPRAAGREVGTSLLGLYRRKRTRLMLNTGKG